MWATTGRTSWRSESSWVRRSPCVSGRPRPRRARRTASTAWRACTGCSSGSPRPPAPPGGGGGAGGGPRGGAGGPPPGPERRAVGLGEALKGAAEPALARGSQRALERLLGKFGRPAQGLAFFGRSAALLAAAPEIAPVPAQASPEVITALNTGGAWRGLTRLSGRPAYVYSSAVQRDERTVGALLVVLGARPLAEAEWRLWRYNGIRFLVLVLVLSAIAFLIVRISVVRPLADMARWTKALRHGGPAGPLELSNPKLFGPMAREVSVLAKSFHRAQAAAEEEAALRLSGETHWTEERLKQFVKLRLGGAPPPARAAGVGGGRLGRGSP